MSHAHPAAPQWNLPVLRHQLLTPLNHIIGYSEMLLEDSPPAGFHHAQQHLARIRQTAREMVRLVHSSLAPHPGRRNRSVLAELRYGLSAPLHTILQSVGAMTSENRDDVNLGDILNIGRAATELLGFAQARPLPIPAMPAQSRRRTNQSSSSSVATAPGRILVVDDSRTNRDLLARRLRKQGHQVTTAASGAEALQKLVQSPQDVVLLDLLMPQLDGFQVLERIKADPARGKIPVIVISALDEIPGVVRSLEMGAEDYLFKPFDPVLLAARLRSCLEKKRLHDLEKRRAEELERAFSQVRIAEQRLRLIVKADHASIWDWDPTANRVAEPGRREKTLEEALARVHPGDRERVRTALMESARRGIEFHCVCRVLRPAGAVVFRESMASPYRAPDGKLLRLIGIAHDVARKPDSGALTPRVKRTVRRESTPSPDRSFRPTARANTSARAADKTPLRRPLPPRSPAGNRHGGAATPAIHR